MRHFRNEREAGSSQRCLVVEECCSWRKALSERGQGESQSACVWDDVRIAQSRQQKTTYSGSCRKLGACTGCARGVGFERWSWDMDCSSGVS